MITLTETAENQCFRVVFQNGVLVGDIYKEVDGYYVFYPLCDTGGFWPSCILRLIADTVDEMNEPWDATCNEYFNSRA